MPEVSTVSRGENLTTLRGNSRVLCISLRVKISQVTQLSFSPLSIKRNSFLPYKFWIKILSCRNWHLDNWEMKYDSFTNSSGLFCFPFFEKALLSNFLKKFIFKWFLTFFYYLFFSRKQTGTNSTFTLMERELLNLNLASGLSLIFVFAWPGKYPRWTETRLPKWTPLRVWTLF